MHFIIKQSVSRYSAIIISGIYVLFGSLWIIFSDKWVDEHLGESIDSIRVQTLKGWFYVLITGILLYFLLKFTLSVIHRSQSELRENHRFIQTLINNLPGMVYRC